MMWVVLVLVLCGMTEALPPPLGGNPSIGRHSYRNFLAKSPRKFTSSTEKKLRFKLYKANKEFVEFQNSAKLGYSSDLNKFSDMSQEELGLYHGLNRTQLVSSANKVFVPTVSAPVSLSWVEKGYVTSIKNQDGCGACWTFGPTVSIEGQYKKLTQKLKQFSNQEILDCVYDAHTYNACFGGTEIRGFEFLAKRKRLALWKDYPYEPVDKPCRSRNKANGFKAAIVTGYTVNDGTEAGTIQRLAQGPLSFAFEAVLSVHFYKKGIYRSDKCGIVANHAVAAVAYSNTFIMIKNSWGADWGDQGFFKFSRNDVACGIHHPDNNFLVTMEVTGGVDDDAEDAPVIYNSDDVTPVPTTAAPKPTTRRPAPVTTSDGRCVDRIEGCMSMFCSFYSSYMTDCRKTCAFCREL